VYHAAGVRAAWTGDTLFAAGCGRACEAPPSVLWQSLCRLRALPSSTRIWCGHDYTGDNLDFALSVLPGDRDCEIRRQAVERLASAGRATVGATLRVECRSNIFLRADAPEVSRSLSMSGSAPADVFAALRARKDNW
ncbi:MAG: hydroxyacylglutathione hydrolase C-terminal domain-containing protein, partial [Kiritimatiellae bacterium]|nr:hydroxyacylglutathione hydrolase C-terminal domain-containing protein [Kiritimatiellia bacterium]